MAPAETAPTLTDGTVTLRAHRPGDAAGVLEQCVDPLSRRWTTVPLDYTYAEAQQFVAVAMPQGWADGSEWGFAVEAVDGAVDGGGARFAGTVSLRHHGSRRAEVAYGAHPWARGRGIMERALRLLLRWGFEERGLATVVWWANTGNWASRRLAWRLGFRVEGTVRQWLTHRGELRDGWVGTLLADDAMEPATAWLDLPGIATERLVLRRHRPDDTPRIVEACSDPETRGWLGRLPRPYTLADADAYVASREELRAAGTALSWAVADPADDRLLASLDLFGIVAGQEAEVGYWVHPDARGRGVATEACRLAVRHALVSVEDGGLGLGRVRGVVAEGNTASLRVLQRAGLTVQGRERRMIRTGHGELVDGLVLDVLAEEAGFRRTPDGSPGAD